MDCSVGFLGELVGGNALVQCEEITIARRIRPSMVAAEVVALVALSESAVAPKAPTTGAHTLLLPASAWSLSNHRPSCRRLMRVCWSTFFAKGRESGSRFQQRDSCRAALPYPVADVRSGTGCHVRVCERYPLPGGISTLDSSPHWMRAAQRSLRMAAGRSAPGRTKRSSWSGKNASALQAGRRAVTGAVEADGAARFRCRERFEVVLPKSPHARLHDCG